VTYSIEEEGLIGSYIIEEGVLKHKNPSFTLTEEGRDL
jgi:hypothetical protein